jgi:predicted ATPase
MLKNVRLTDFKSFADESIELSPLTFLVGANASGKSNFLDALRFLQGQFFDLSLAEVINGEERTEYDAWPGIRGRAEETARVGQSSFTIESTWEVVYRDEGESADNIFYDFGPEPLAVAHRMTCRTQPQVRLDAERLAVAGDTPEELFAIGPAENGRIEVPWSPVSWPGREQAPEGPARLMLPTSQSMLWSILGSINPGSPRVPERTVQYAAALSYAFAHVRLLAIEPAQMRGYGRTGAPLGSGGKNLSGVLADLCSDEARKQSLVDWLAELCAPELTDIEIIRVDPLGDVMAMLVEKGGRRISVRSLSDGTLYFLGTLLALHTAAPGSVLLIEEIAAGLHPARIRLLIESLQSAHRERGIQVIATTHSPAVLQWLDEETLGNTVLFARIPEQEGSVVRRFRDLPRFSEVVRTAGIEEMFTTGWLEMAL